MQTGLRGMTLAAENKRRQEAMQEAREMRKEQREEKRQAQQDQFKAWQSNYKMLEQQLKADGSLDTEDQALLSRARAMISDPGGMDKLMESAIPAPEGTNLGRYNPGDFTPSSWSEFTRLLSEGVPENVANKGLERYEPSQQVMIGDVPYAFDRVNKVWVPAKVGGQQVTPASVGGMQGQVAASAADVETSAERAREATSPAFAQSITDLQGELDWIGKNEGAFKSIYGAIEGRTPNVQPPARDAAAHRDRLANLLTLAERGKLKGQGTISDFESEMLRQAATILSDSTISDKEALAEVARIQSFVAKMGRRRSGATGSPPSASQPNENDPLDLR
jgi:hypothetical protein